jgi:ABC-type Fe3+ transport system permease subunit
MDVLSLLIGTFAVVFGFFTLFTRRGRNKDMLKKLTVMQERYGDKTGSLIHTIVYSILPIAFGLLIIAAGIFRSS